MAERIHNSASATASGPRVADDELDERVVSVLNAVEETAERIRADAVRAAEATRPRTARAAARRIAEQGQRRLAGFRKDARALERRFEAAIDELGELVSQLEDVVLSAGPGETATWPTISPRRSSTRQRPR